MTGRRGRFEHLHVQPLPPLAVVGLVLLAAGARRRCRNVFRAAQRPARRRLAAAGCDGQRARNRLPCGRDRAWDGSGASRFRGERDPLGGGRGTLRRTPAARRQLPVRRAALGHTHDADAGDRPARLDVLARGRGTAPGGGDSGLGGSPGAGRNPALRTAARSRRSLVRAAVRANRLLHGEHGVQSAVRPGERARPSFPAIPGWCSRAPWVVTVGADAGCRLRLLRRLSQPLAVQQSPLVAVVARRGRDLRHDRHRFSNSRGFRCMRA